MPYKLHPLSVPYRTVQSSLGLLPLLFVAAIVIGQFYAFVVPIIALLLILGVAGIIGWQIAYFRRFEYELTSDTFDIRSGVISRRNREIPYGRIQNVDISRSMIQRALGLAELRLETAGGSSSEAHLRYVGYDEAKQLQNSLRNRERRVQTPTIGEEPAPQGALLYRITERDLGVLAIASFDLRVASFLAVILSITAPSVIVGLVLALPIDPLIVVLALALVVVIASGILSGGSAIINNYGFTLHQIGEELRYERGLLQRYDGSIPRDKIQSLIIQENVLKRLIGYASLTVETAGYAPGQGGAESARAVPIAERPRLMQIANQIEPSVEELPFHRPAPQARIRYTLQYVIVVAIATVVAFGGDIMIDYSIVWWVVPLLVVLAPVAAHYKWKHRGYALADEAILTRSGFWRRKTHVVPYYRIQIVEESQTVLQRRWRIATVLVDTAGSSGLVSGDPTAYDLRQHDATMLRNRLSDELQVSLIVHKRRRQGVRDRFVQGVRGIW